MTLENLENQYFQWVNPLFQWPFSIAMLVITRGNDRTDDACGRCHGEFEDSAAERLLWLCLQSRAAST